jgi:long-subunit acyl-CoA synthetase (AMP-forming)
MNTLIEKLQQQADLHPEAPALRSRDKRLSYAELMQAVQQASAQLRSMQLQTLGLYLDNGIDWIIFDLAALATGVSVVPLPWFFSAAQIEHAIVDARLDGIVFDTALPGCVRACGEALPGYSDSRLQRIEKTVVTELARATTAAKISYTSGSTGTPKAVVLDARFIEQTADSVCAAIGSLDIKTHLSILPYATLLENIAGVYAPLLLGRCVHAEPTADIGLSATLGLDPAKLQECFSRVRPNSLIVTPQLLDLLCILVEREAVDPDCLVFVAVGGARVAPALLRRARRAGIPAYEGYGLTEFASVATLNTPQQDRIGSVGKPLPGVTIVIAADGEICLARDSSALGSRHQRIVRTGDYGSIDDDGFVQVYGRKSNLIVLANGRNVSPEWIESELNDSKLIAQSYVYSDDGESLSALLATKADHALVEAWIARVNRDLPAYAHLAQWHRLATPFSREQQTLTANGRLRRQRIEQQLPELLSQTAVQLAQAGIPQNLSLQERSS